MRGIDPGYRHHLVKPSIQLETCLAQEEYSLLQEMGQDLVRDRVLGDRW
jgi:hypothetical protein